MQRLEVHDKFSFIVEDVLYIANIHPVITHGYIGYQASDKSRYDAGGDFLHTVVCHGYNGRTLSDSFINNDMDFTEFRVLDIEIEKEFPDLYDIWCVNLSTGERMKFSGVHPDAIEIKQ